KFIQPHRLAYKSVVKQRGRPPTRAQVGPSRREAQYKDPFYRLGVDPLKQAMNPAMLLPFISEMGKVYGRNVTGLTKKNQRRVGKAIRRAKMMGIIPILSKRNIFQLSHSNISKK
ncbi:ribosomal protein S18, partial [Lentinula edodes]